MNTTEQMMNDYYTQMANRIPICVCEGETSFHSLSKYSFSSIRSKVFEACGLRFSHTLFIGRFLNAAVECLAMAGIVFFAALFTLLLGA